MTWKAQLQSLVVLSTIEAEYVAICDCGKEAVWKTCLLNEINLFNEVPSLYTNIRSLIYLSKNLVFQERTKYVAVKFHYTRRMIEPNTVKLFKVDTTENPSDAGTTIVSVSKFRFCLELLHIGKKWVWKVKSESSTDMAVEDMRQP